MGGGGCQHWNLGRKRQHHEAIVKLSRCVEVAELVHRCSCAAGHLGGRNNIVNTRQRHGWRDSLVPPVDSMSRTITLGVPTLTAQIPKQGCTISMSMSLSTEIFRRVSGQRAFATVVSLAPNFPGAKQKSELVLCTIRREKVQVDATHNTIQQVEYPGYGPVRNSKLGLAVGTTGGGGAI